MNSEGVDIYSKSRSKERNYYIESKRLRSEVIGIAESLKGNPMNFRITNGITMDVEITKSDLKTVVGKNTTNDKFNAIKNALAKDLKGFIEKAKYAGIRETKDGKHPETAFFAYYSRKLGANTYLCMRRIKNTGKFKPYAIISKDMFDAGYI